jgi:alpha-ribazole phosphatase
MTRVFLIRHGHVENPAHIFYGPDISISSRGERQIEALSQDMNGSEIRPALILSSPYRRAVQTADILARHFPDAMRKTDERLVEWQVGDWYGKPLADFYTYTKYEEHPADVLPPDIEPLSFCAARVHDVLRETVEQYPSADICIVSHREPMASAILSYQDMGWESIHDLSLPVSSAWELVFEASNQPITLKKRFDRSGME